MRSASIPRPPFKESDMTQDEEHLRLLSIFHYVLAGLAGIFGLFPIAHLVVGLTFVFAPHKMQATGDAPPEVIGWLFVAFALIFIIGGLTLCGLLIAAGRFITQRRRYMFCLVVAGISCLFMPLGTILGVFTIIVLQRDSVKQLFNVPGKAPV
jgi:hypothetical protein